MGFLLSMLFGFKRLLSGFWTWATKDPMRLVIVALIALCAFLALSNASLRADIRHHQKVIALREATIKQMVAANQTVTKRAKENVRRVRRLYAEINHEAEKDFDTRIAANKLALRKWMQQNNRSATGKTDSASSATMSGEVVPDTETAIVPVSDLEIASDNYSQLTALIAWAESIGRVETVLE